MRTNFDAALDHVTLACCWIVVFLALFFFMLMLLPQPASPRHRLDALFAAPKITLRAQALGKPTCEAAR